MLELIMTGMQERLISSIHHSSNTIGCRGLGEVSMISKTEIVEEIFSTMVGIITKTKANNIPI